MQHPINAIIAILLVAIVQVQTRIIALTAPQEAHSI